MLKTIRTIWESLNSKEKNYLSLALWIIAIFGFTSIFIAPKLFNLPSPWKWMQFDSKTSDVSNTVNGIATPIIALVSAFLTFLAFWVQYQANVQQKELFDQELKKKLKDDDERDKTWRIERFENRFYELLNLHRANLDDMSIHENLRGRKLFAPMFYELKFVYKYAELILNQNQDLKSKLPASFRLLPFVYRIFFFGIGANSEKYYVVYFTQSEIQLYEIIKKFLSGTRKSYASLRDQNPQLTYHKVNPPIAADEDDLTGTFYYTPFDGHVTRLGHYYRHLYQTAKYIICQTIFIEEEKYEYVKVLRAQLSDFEQLLLYYNALAWFDSEWKVMFTDYRLIKNLPLPLADFDEKPEDHFALDIKRLRLEKDVEMFEWNE